MSSEESTSYRKRSRGRGKGRIPDPLEERRIQFKISLLPSTVDYLRRLARISSFPNPTRSRIIADLIVQYQIEHPDTLTFDRVRDPEEKPIDW